MVEISGNLIKIFKRSESKYCPVVSTRVHFEQIKPLIRARRYNNYYSRRPQNLPETTRCFKAGLHDLFRKNYFFADMPILTVNTKGNEKIH